MITFGPKQRTVFVVTRRPWIRWQFGRLPEEKVSRNRPPARRFVSFSVSILFSTRFRRYVAKVLYTYILGYKVDVGHMEAVNLISSPKYSEKQIVSALVLGV
jgi:hypothetical protein